VHALKVDLSQEKEIVEAFNWIKTNLKKVDVLVNNAAVLIATDVLSKFELIFHFFRVSVSLVKTLEKL
jgi:Short-chain dehydrogenases of various substrate specificities